MPPAIALTAINKRFGDVHANRDVSLAVEPGSIHGIIGENGAGKSTLVNILYGFYTIDSGQISINGVPVVIRHAADAIAHGIGMVHQHFMLVPNFTVLENVMLGHEGSRQIDKAAEKARHKLMDLIENFGLAVDLDAIVEDLPVGLQQRVEILKALYRGADILILDEPTGVLTPQETDQLFNILAMLREQGVTVLLITHKLKEIMAITSAVSVMRAGQMVAHRKTAETSPAELAELMVGRKVLLKVDHTPAKPGQPVLEVQQLGLDQAQGLCGLDEVSLTLREGEILGIAGVSGNGQSELLDILSGIRMPDRGQFRACGMTVGPDQVTDPAALRRIGVAHVPEDRHKRGIVMPFSAAETVILGYSDSPEENSGWWLSPDRLEKGCAELMDQFDVRPPNPKLASENFSGGNQQKLVLAREINRQPKLLLIGQPTRGVDIGAIEFIHRQLIAMRDRGCAILLVSVELDEIMSLADRIVVMNGGRIVGELDREDADERKLGLMMAGIERDAAPQEARS
ncbi:MAG: ABC transporter ATP-binding protein [Candidatus Puniceispirillales bacterium]